MREWIRDALMWVWNRIVSVFRGILDAILEPLNALMQTVNDLWNQLPDGVVWGAEIIAFDYGMTVILSAYVMRFLIRRLPVVG